MSDEEIYNHRMDYEEELMIDEANTFVELTDRRIHNLERSIDNKIEFYNSLIDDLLLDKYPERIVARLRYKMK